MMIELSVGIEVIILFSGAVMLGFEKVRRAVSYKNEKLRLKRNLIKSFEENNKDNIKKYIEKLKDFDKRKQTNKLEKYLYKVIKKIPTLNEYNVISLIDNFVLINEIFTSETSMKNEIDKKLEEKLKKIEKQKIEVKIRNDRLKHQLALKQEKIKKNEKKLVRRI